MKNSALLIFGLVFKITGFCQKIADVKGGIVDTSHIPLIGAIVTIENSGNQLGFALTDKSGQFQINISTGKYDTLVIKISFLGFAPKEIKYLAGGESDLGIIILFPITQVLKEVIVRPKPISIKGDTTSFLLSAFKNKQDENLEDVLKKIAGFDIDESGSIRYNGKRIENILIEGDELTNNYKLISRNISPEMVEKMEIIDKYSKNPILKEFGKDQGQVMNLILKGGWKMKVFGKIDAAIGDNNMHKAAANAFFLNKGLKLMFIGSSNNTGSNPYSEVLVDERFTTAKDYDFDATVMPAFIKESPVFDNNSIDSKSNSLFNNSRLGVLNGNQKIDQHSSLKLFTDIFSDNIYQYKNTTSTNYINPAASYSQNEEKRLSPIFKTLSSEYLLNYKSYQLQIGGITQFKNFGENSNIAAGFNNQAYLRSHFERMGSNTLFTKKMDSLKAYQLYFQYLKDKKDQALNSLSDSLRKIPHSQVSSNQLNQITNATVGYAKAGIRYFLKQKRSPRLDQFEIGFQGKKIDMGTKFAFFSGTQFVNPDSFDNLSSSNLSSLHFLYQTSFQFRKLAISLKSNLRFSKSKHKQEDVNTSISKLYFLPDLTVKYNAGQQSNLTLNLKLNTSLPDYTTLGCKPILGNYRNFYSADFYPLDILNSTVMLNYIYNDITEGKALIISIMRYQKSRTQIDDIFFDKYFINHFSTNEIVTQKFSNVYIKYDKLINSIHTAVSLKNTFNFSTYPTKVNSVIASSKTFSYSARLAIRPVVLSFANVYFGVEYFLSRDIQSNNEMYNYYPFIEAGASVSKWVSFSLNYKQFFSSYSFKKRSFSFVNATAWITIIPKKMEGKISVQNLWNVKNVYSGYKFTYLENRLTDRILPRFGLLELSYKF